MAVDQNRIHGLYKRLLKFYPSGFKEQFSDAMEQTFNDLWNEKLQKKKGLPGFVLWTFLETTIGIFREYSLLIFPGDMMQNALKTFGSSTLISLIFILPFAIMEIINRRNYNEDFPFALFFVLWLNLFAVSVILFPILRAMRAENHDASTPFTNPKSTLLISILLFVAPGIFPLLNFLGWVNVDRLFNGPNPEQLYIPGQILALLMISFPITAGVIAGRPIVNTLQQGGRLLAYPVHLIIVVGLSFLFAAGVFSLLVDQWPCFMGVPLCD